MQDVFLYHKNLCRPLIELSFNCYVFTQWLVVVPVGELWSAGTTVEGVKFWYMKA